LWYLLATSFLALGENSQFLVFLLEEKKEGAMHI
jgi:hypothetical protein